MMRFVGVTAIIVALAAASPAIARSVEARPAATAAPSREVVELLALMRPRQAAIDAELAVFDRGASMMFADSSDISELEAIHPGLREKLVAAARAVLEVHAPRIEDRLRGRLAGVLARELTADEVRGLTDFYISSVGTAIIEQMVTSGDRMTDERVKKMIESDRVTKRQLDEIKTEAVKGLSLSGRQQEKLVEFAKSPLFAKLQKVNGKLVAVQLEEANAPEPEMDKDMEAAIGRVFEGLPQAPK